MRKTNILVLTIMAIVIIWLARHANESKLDFAKPTGNFDAKANIIASSGNKVGEAYFYGGVHGIIIDVFINSLPSGKKGMHIHNKAVCENEKDFKTAGPHVNHMQKEHGLLNEKGLHEGNLPNIFINSQGQGIGQFFNGFMRIHSNEQNLPNLLDADGSSIVIHEAPDDHYTQPLGGSGKRIACGKIEGITTY